VSIQHVRASHSHQIVEGLRLEGTSGDGAVQPLPPLPAGSATAGFSGLCPVRLEYLQG